MKKVRDKIFIYASAFILFSVIAIFPEKKMEMEKATPLYLAHDTLICDVFSENHIGVKGYSLGYIYELFSCFDKDQLCKTVITPVYDTIDSWRSLNSGEIDIFIINSMNDTVPDYYQDKTISSIPINSAEDVCVVRKKDYFFVQIFNSWFTYFKQTNEYHLLYDKYHKNYRYAKGISPYDQQIKKYSMLLGWDWRLLASLIYQESKFKVGVSSSRGAIGLMQIREAIARNYGIENIYDPSENIKAGCMHLMRLQKMYGGMGADSLNSALISIAAYNCGEGRMRDIMKVAEALDKPYLQWDTLATVIPLMAEKKYYSLPEVKLGKFKGNETLNYVENILSRYDEYKENVP